MREFLVSIPLFEPFIEYAFMRRALAGCLALSLGATPIGRSALAHATHCASKPG